MLYITHRIGVDTLWNTFHNFFFNLHKLGLMRYSIGIDPTSRVSEVSVSPIYASNTSFDTYPLKFTS